MVAVRGALSVKERNASFTVRILHSTLDVGIHLIYEIEEDVHLVFLLMKIPFHQAVGMGMGPIASSSKYSM